MTKVLHEKKRGCGYRKKGGLYLTGGSDFAACCKLPFPLTKCNCCGSGIKPTRGFTWINTDLFAGAGCSGFSGCILAQRNKKIGLLWIGEKFYNHPQDFLREAHAIGISRRVSQLPKDVIPGETWIALAHRKGHADIDGKGLLVQFTGAVICVFKLRGVEYVIKGDEDPAELERMEKRGITPVDVRPDHEQLRLHVTDGEK